MNTEPLSACPTITPVTATEAAIRESARTAAPFVTPALSRRLLALGPYFHGPRRIAALFSAIGNRAKEPTLVIDFLRDNGLPWPRPGKQEIVEMAELDWFLCLMDWSYSTTKEYFTLRSLAGLVFATCCPGPKTGPWYIALTRAMVTANPSGGPFFHSPKDPSKPADWVVKALGI